MADQKEEERSYYDVLGLAKDASPEEIRRAYRTLSAAFHPDKQQNDELREHATDAFTDISEAYEVLSDPDKRKVYDVYGRLGLRAGLEVGAKHKSFDELKREWQSFQDARRAQQIEIEAAPQSHLQVKLLAVDMLKDLRQGVLRRGLRGQVVLSLPRLPIITQATMSSSIQFVPTDALLVSLGGHAAMVTQRHASRGLVMIGGTSIPVLVRYDLSPNDQLQLEANFGLDRKAVSLTSVRQLTQYDAAQVSLNLSEAGLGLQIVSQRQLFERTKGELTWVMGPPELSGMSISIQQRFDNMSLQGKLEVGAVTSLSAKLTLKCGAKSLVKSVGVLGTTGMHLEVGLARRWGELFSTYFGVQHGIFGTVVKLKMNRAGHVFEAPVMVSPRFDDWQTLLMVTLGPAAANYLITRLVVSPLLRLYASKQAGKRRHEEREELEKARRDAEAKQGMMAPIIARMAAEEARRDGLVIVTAVYGCLDEWRTTFAEQAAEYGRSGAEGGATAGSSTNGHGDHQEPVDDLENVSQQGNVGSSAPVLAAVPPGAKCAAAQGLNGGAAGPDCDTGPAGMQNRRAYEGCLDVTRAVQYQVTQGRVHIGADREKGQLLGFADLDPEGQKRLYVMYRNKGSFYEVEVGDTDALKLPHAKATRLQGPRAEFAQHLLAKVLVR